MKSEWPQRLYRLVLHVYPASFRREYGDEMAQLFRDICRDTYAKYGRLSVLNLWLPLLRDLIPSAVVERRQALLAAGPNPRIRGAIIGALAGLGLALSGSRQDLLIGPLMGAMTGTVISSILAAMRRPEARSEEGTASRILGAFGGGIAGMVGGALLSVRTGLSLGSALGIWQGEVYTGTHAVATAAVLTLVVITGVIGGTEVGARAGARTACWAGSLIATGD